MTAATLTDVPARTLPCTADPDLFQIVGPGTITGRAQIVAALLLCWSCPIEAACRESTARWPEPPRNTVVGGVFYDWRRRVPRRAAIHVYDEYGAMVETFWCDYASLHKRRVDGGSVP